MAQRSVDVEADVQAVESTSAQPLVSSEERKNYAGICWVPIVVTAGVIIGLIVPVGSDEEQWGAARFSSVLGWSYFTAWTVSFYPQVVQNWSRKSIVGLSVDFQMMNLVGFLCYFMFNLSLFANPSVRQEYREQHHGHDPAVQINDVVFAGHAVLITMVTLAQIVMYYDYPPLDGADKTLRIVVVCCLAAVLVAALICAAIVAGTSEGAFTWLAYLNGLSEVKVVISVVKYCPQVWMNIRRKSTDGWSIHNVLLDFSGGFLSVVQLLFDAWRMQDASAITGNPAKLLLGNLSMFFDVIFMVQHYCLYRTKPRRIAAD